MLGIVGDDGGRDGNNYDSRMKTIVTSGGGKENGGLWVNFANGGGSFFMDNNGSILENVDDEETHIRYHDYTIDWKDEWMGADSDGGSEVTTTEFQDAIHHWLEDIPVRGHVMSTADLQEIIVAWLDYDPNAPSAQYTCSGGDQKIGDVNNDGSISLMDFCVNVDVGTGTLPYPLESCCGDVTGDGIIDIADSDEIMSYTTGGTKGFSAGYSCNIREHCSDEIDNDCDGNTDCSDSDCYGDPVCPISYCSSNSINYKYEHISRVYLNGYTATSAGSTYSDNTGSVFTTISPGRLCYLYIDVKTTGNYNEDVMAWIDFNKDGDFTDSGEAINMGSYTFSGTHTFIRPITIPTNAIPGDTRMRVSLKYPSAPLPCESFVYGEVEDYTITITTKPPFVILRNLEVQLMGDYNSLTSEYSAISVEGDNIGNACYGTTCSQCSGSYDTWLSQKDIDTVPYCADGLFEVSFADSSGVDCCCNAIHRVCIGGTCCDAQCTTSGCSNSVVFNCNDWSCAQ